jgi:hypothetical protein
MELVEVEAGRHNWDALRRGCGSTARHLGLDLVELARAQSAAEASRDRVVGHVLSAVYLTAPSVPAASVALAALTGDLSDAARRLFLELLLSLAAGEGQALDPALAGRDLVAECRAAIRNGLWILYAEMMHPTSVDTASNAFETLSLVEQDQDRLDHVREVAADNLRRDLRK